MLHLNPRQREVLLLIAKGFHNGEIGRHLGLSERSVKCCVSQLLLMFDASNRTELVGLQLESLEDYVLISNEPSTGSSARSELRYAAPGTWSRSARRRS
jgi:DNA-binding CsgD family transcriptional regulator